jgi:hypothetical protein
MSTTELTRHAALLAGGVSLIALGGWYAGLNGLHHELADAHAELTLQHVALNGAPGPIKDADDKAAALQARIDEARAMLSATPGPDGVYDAVQKLARDTGIRLDRLEPLGSSPAPVDPKKQGGYAVESLGFDAEISGDYDKIIAFIAGIENGMGLSKVTALRVAPLPGREGDRSMVLAKVTTRHFVQVTDVSKPKPAETAKPQKHTHAEENR